MTHGDTNSGNVFVALNPWLLLLVHVLGVLARHFHVPHSRVPDKLDLLWRCISHALSGYAYNQRVRRKCGIHRHQSTGSHNTVVSNLGTVHHRRAHAYQAVVSDGACVQYRGMSDCYIIPHYCRELTAEMNDRVVLNVGAAADLDLIDICS